MLLVESRRGARTTPAGDLVVLAEQDRDLWDGALIVEGQTIVRQCVRRNQPGPYQIQAAINAVHGDASTAAARRQIVQLYDQLLPLVPTPVVALNRAVAVAEVEGPAVALTLVLQLEADLEAYYLYHVICADPAPAPGPCRRGRRGLRGGDDRHRKRDRAPVYPTSP
jgi:RNA polymerase sigma-70 factor (ECF subfamily)